MCAWQTERHFTQKENEAAETVADKRPQEILFCGTILHLNNTILQFFCLCVSFGPPKEKHLCSKLQAKTGQYLQFRSASAAERGGFNEGRHSRTFGIIITSTCSIKFDITSSIPAQQSVPAPPLCSTNIHFNCLFSACFASYVSLSVRGRAHLCVCSCLASLFLSFCSYKLQ